MPIPQLRQRSVRDARPQLKRYSPKKKGGFFKKLIIRGGITGVLIVTAILVVINSSLPPVDRIYDRQLEESTVIFDRTGEHVLFQIFEDVQRNYLSLSDVPTHIQQATLVAEDRDFYSHRGIKLSSIIRAALSNIVTLDLTGQGGSTITQQFVKNAILTPEKTYTRKIKEVLLSYKIERELEKDEILELYLNEIPYGSTAYGIEAAAQRFFGKSAADITIAEGAILAALPKATTFYSPYGNNIDRLIDRQHFILDGMVAEDYITEDQAETAKTEALVYKETNTGILAPHFVFYLKEELAKEYGDRLVELGGLKIISTIDLDLQKKAEELLAEQVEKNTENYNATNAAMIVLDPKTGEILAMVGSKNYFDRENDGNVNVTTRPRQPGSSFKPIVYATAFEKGFTPKTKVFDVVTDFPTLIEGTYTPLNYNLKTYGLLPLRNTLAGSLNIPAVKLLYLVGIEPVLEFAENAGYTTFADKSRFGLSLVLGGGEVKLLEHAAAFAMFANEGVYKPPAGFLKIEDKDGRTIAEYKEEATKVLGTNSARLINDVLSDPEARVFAFGRNNTLNLPDRSVAAKTGTTDNFVDSWTMGYTPNMVIGVWVGNNDNSPMREGAFGGNVAAPLWKAMMIEATKDLPKESFAPPTAVTSNNPSLDGEGIGEVTVLIDTVSGKLATEYTPEDKRLEKTFFDSHSILYYIDKNNPNGPPLADPTQDPHFVAWEEGVHLWAEENQFTIEPPPIDVDDVHLPQFFPEIRINSPSKNTKVTSRNLTIDVATSSSRPIAFVDYAIDGRPVARINDGDFGATIDMNNFENGWHTLTVTVNDTVGSKGTDTLTFELELTRTTPGFSWIQPVNLSVISLDDFPLAIRFKTPTPELTERADIQARNSITGERITIDNNISLTDASEKEVLWETVEPGNWELQAIITARDTSQVSSLGPILLINPSEQTDEEE